MSRAWIQGGAVALSSGVAIWGVLWLLTPSQAEMVAEGRELFVHEWVPNDELSGGGDGLGPVFNAQSCVACHFQGGVGGAGGPRHNVTAFQVLPNRNDSEPHGGVIHAGAIEVAFRETRDNVRRLYDVIPEETTVVNGCSITKQSFDPLIVDVVNTPALYGAGLIDDISTWSIKSSRRGRVFDEIGAEFNLQFDAVPPGKLISHSYGRAGKFGWRGQFASLEEFVATACAVELGLSNSHRAQDLPRKHQPDDSAELDMTNHQLAALVTYCRELPRPEQVLPTDPTQRTNAQAGQKTFHEIGCTTCHLPEIGGVTGVYSDFLLYSLEDPEEASRYERKESAEAPLPNDMARPDEWQTPPLWGVADSAPYMHNGSQPTLEAAINQHHGAATSVRERYRNLPEFRRQQLIQFLSTLRAPVAAEPVVAPTATASL